MNFDVVNQDPPADYYSRRPDKRGRAIKWVVVLVFILIVAAGAGLYLWKHSSNSLSIPPKISKAASYTIYFPSKLPRGYRLVNNTPKYEGGIVFYSLQSGNQKISATEQALPTPEALHIPGFNEIQTAAGTALVGTNNDQPTLFLIAGKTLVSLRSSGLDGRAALVETAQNMQPVD